LAEALDHRPDWVVDTESGGVRKVNPCRNPIDSRDNGGGQILNVRDCLLIAARCGWVEQADKQLVDDVELHDDLRSF
jgi:hypothetical protein